MYFTNGISVGACEWFLCDPKVTQPLNVPVYLVISVNLKWIASKKRWKERDGLWLLCAEIHDREGENNLPSVFPAYGVINILSLLTNVLNPIIIISNLYSYITRV